MFKDQGTRDYKHALPHKLQIQCSPSQILRNWLTDLKFMWQYRRPGVAKILLGKDNIGELAPLASWVCLEATVIKAAWYVSETDVQNKGGHADV